MDRIYAIKEDGSKVTLLEYTGGKTNLLKEAILTIPENTTKLSFYKAAGDSVCILMIYEVQVANQ